MGSTGCEPDEIQEIKRQWEGAYNSCVGPPRMERNYSLVTINYKKNGKSVNKK